MPSTKDLSGLPAPSELRDAMQFSAMLDIVLCDEQWLRSYDFQPKWSDGIAMAKYDNGGGNDMFVFFRGRDTIIKGFDHESPVSPHAREEYAVWPGIYDGVPSSLDELFDDAAVERDEVTFCVWHTSGKWCCGSMTFPEQEDDGSSYLLGAIRVDSGSYCDWAGDYYGRELNNASIASVYSGKLLDAELIAAINPDRDVNAALAELSEVANV